MSLILALALIAGCLRVLGSSCLVPGRRGFSAVGPHPFIFLDIDGGDRGVRLKDYFPRRGDLTPGGNEAFALEATGFFGGSGDDLLGGGPIGDRIFDSLLPIHAGRMPALEINRQFVRLDHGEAGPLLDTLPGPLKEFLHSAESQAMPAFAADGAGMADRWFHAAPFLRPSGRASFFSRSRMAFSSAENRSSQVGRQTSTFLPSHSTTAVSYTHLTLPTSDLV